MNEILIEFRKKWKRILDIKSISIIINNYNLLNKIKVLDDKEDKGKSYNIIQNKKEDFFNINIPIQDSIEMDNIIRKLIK